METISPRVRVSVRQRKETRKKSYKRDLFTVDVKAYNTSFGGFGEISGTIFRTHEITPKIDQFPNKL